jgi:hypothetical protein
MPKKNAEIDAVYYGSFAKDGKVMVYDSSGNYKSKWTPSKVLESGALPLTEIKQDVTVADTAQMHANFFSSRGDVRPGIGVVYNRKGRRLPCMIVAVTDKAIQVATYYRISGGKPINCTYYEIGRSRASVLLELPRLDSDEIPRDPKTGMDDWELSGDDVLFCGKVVGTVTKMNEQDAYGVEIKNDKYSKELRRAVKDWFMSTAKHRKYAGIEDAIDWWVVYQNAKQDNMAMTATDFFLEHR